MEVTDGQKERLRSQGFVAWGAGYASMYRWSSLIMVLFLLLLVFETYMEKG